MSSLSLNDALSSKDMNRFWKSWRAKFGHKSPATMIDGRNDAKDIADRFASVFQDACVPNSLQHHNEMKTQFSAQYMQYAGENLDDKTISVDLVSQCIEELNKGKAHTHTHTPI